MSLDAARRDRGDTSIALLASRAGILQQPGTAGVRSVSGTNALYGFRYQVLRTVERVLEMYVEEPAGDWVVEIESATDEVVDYAELNASGVTRAVQVKASMPGSTTRLRENEALTILSRLASAYPNAGEVALESNRTRGGTWTAFPNGVDATDRGGPRQRAFHDSRGLEELENSVFDTLRSMRSSAHVVADARTLRHLAYVLEAMVWQRGAQPHQAVSASDHQLTPSDVAATVLVAGKDLADRVGAVPWGKHWSVPSSDRIARPDVIGILSLLLPMAALGESGPPAIAAVTGFSGAGKSSAVAGWADVHQESYAMVLWLPARNEESLADSVRQLLAAEVGDEVFTWDRERARAEFLGLLGRTPLSWLLVFDDATSAETVHAWTPSRGFGHVLITTRDSTWLPGSAPSVEVPPMDEDAASMLVRRRMARGTDAFSDLERAVIQRLLQQTGGWPLAIEMMLSWVTRTGRALVQADQYLDCLPDVLLDRQELVPPGYPRTVVAAVVEALDHIATEPGANAWGVLLTCGRLGSKSVPVVLLRRLLGPSPRDPATVMAVDDAIGELKSLSLIRRQELSGRLDPEWADRLFVNDIVSDLALRLADDDLESELAAAESLDQALRESVDVRDFHLAASLADMASAVIEAIAQQRRLFSIPHLSLHGNLALVHQHRGDFEAADKLLRAEIGLALSIAVDNDAGIKSCVAAKMLAAHSLMQLAQVSTNNDRPDVIIHAARLSFELVNHGPHEISDDRLSRLLAGLVDALRTVRNQEFFAVRDELIAQIEELAGGIELTLAQQVEQALRDGKNAVAESLARQAIDVEPDPLMRLRLTCRLVEATVPRNFDEALRLLEDVAKRSYEIGVGTSLLEDAALSAALPLWSPWLAEDMGMVVRDRSPSAARLGDLLQYLPGEDSPSTTPGNRVRTLIARAIHSALQGSPVSLDAISKALHAVEVPDGRLATEEVRAMRIAAHWASALQIRVQAIDVADARSIALSEDIIFVGLDSRDMARIRSVYTGPGLLSVEVALWHAALTVDSYNGGFTIWIDFSKVPINLFDRIKGTALVMIFDTADTVTVQDGQVGAPPNRLLVLGLAMVRLKEWVTDIIREGLAADCS